MAVSCLLSEPPDQIALRWKKMPRTGSGGKGDDLKRRRPPIPLICGGGERKNWSRR